MARAEVDMDIQVEDEFQHAGPREAPVLRYYQASEMLPDRRGPLHKLMEKQPAVLGSLQIVSGILSVGVGILFALTSEMGKSLFTLFRVSQMTGVLFIGSGLVSNLLFKYPVLLNVSLVANCSSMVVAAIGACLICVDLSHPQEHKELFKMEVLGLCVLGFEVFLSAILCFWFSKEKHAKSP
ncbi:unnamed protein product [Ophioblennius macclurei]